MNPQIAVIGSLNADFVTQVTRFPVPGETMIGQRFQVFPGGKGANQAYAVAKLGGDVRMIGQVGTDTQGSWLKEHLSAAGVDVSHVHQDATTSSGVAVITIDAQGQNHIIIVAGANGTFTPDLLEHSRAAITSAGLVLLQLEIPLPTVQAAAALARKAGALVILDPAPAQAIPDQLLACADYVTPNETELAILTQTPPQELTRSKAATLGQQLLARGARNVIIKLGSQGALLLSPGQAHFWPAIPVKAVDTTAAGDAFNAAFAFALAVGRSVTDAGKFATAAAACSVRRPGAQPSMPTFAEVDQLLQQAM